MKKHNMKTNEYISLFFIRLFIASTMILYFGALPLLAQMGSVGNYMSNFGIKYDNFNSVNPAFQYCDSLGIYIALPSFFVTVANNNMSIDNVNYYFGNEESKYLTDSDKQDILSTFDDDGRYYTKINTSMPKLYLGLGSIGTIGFEVNDHINGNLILPKELIEVALIGNQVNKQYTFDNLNIQSWWVRNYALNYAKQVYKRDRESKSSIEEITIGSKIKYVQGFAYFGTESINSSFYTNHADNSLKGSYKATMHTAFSPNLGIKYNFDPTYAPIKNISIFPESVGSGLGIDVGLNLVFSSGVNLSLAINDIGSIKWNKHTAEHKYSGNFYIKDFFNKQHLDSLKKINIDESKYISEFSTSLPTNLQLGTSIDIAKYIQPFDKWIWFINYSQGLNNSPGNSKKAIIELGNYFNFGEWIPAGLIALRYDETGSLRVPLMLNYSMQYFFIGFNTMDVLSLFSSSVKKPNFSAGLMLGLKFN